MHRLISPSLLSADFGKLREEIEMINSSEADWIHIDIMDGVFVPNISFGFPVLKYINKYAKKPLDVHLMIVKPERYFEKFKEYGASILTIHYEGCNHLHRSVNAIKDLGMTAGVVLNPHTPVNSLDDIIGVADLVLLMSVNPGFGGQKFIENTYSKITQLRNLINNRQLKTQIEIDGGVDLTNAGKLFQAGADILVAGNSVFSSPNPNETISKLKQS
jgi:ribulose-phosphate 3-epimerase